MRKYIARLILNFNAQTIAIVASAIYNYYNSVYVQIVLILLNTQLMIL